MRRLLLAAVFLAGCGVKGPPRAPHADAPPPELARRRCVNCVVEEPAEETPALVDQPQVIPPEAEPGTETPDEGGER